MQSISQHADHGSGRVTCRWCSMHPHWRRLGHTPAFSHGLVGMNLRCADGVCPLQSTDGIGPRPMKWYLDDRLSDAERAN